MKLQMALDGDWTDSRAVLAQVHQHIDIAEIGTPLIFREGMNTVRFLRAAYPHLALLADLKIMDGGEHEAAIAFEAGADLVTVLGGAHDNTVRGAVAAARRFGKQIMVDMLQVSQLVERARELLTLGVDYLCVHTAYDLQHSGETPLADLQALRTALPNAPLAAAGGIKLETLGAVLACQPQIVVVGGAITRAAQPAEVAGVLRERIQVDDSLRQG
jgi:3-hexulose-6-phosphate synthase